MTPSEFRAMRLKIGLTQEQLARRLDTTLRTICRLELEVDRIPVRYELALRWLEMSEKTDA